MAENKHGVWLDKDTGKVVRGKAPAHARLLVAPGKDVTKADEETIARFETEQTEILDGQAVAPAEKPFESETDTKPAAKKAAAKRAPKKP